MTRVVSFAAGRPYTLAEVCRVWEVPRSSVYSARNAPGDASPGRRRGPLGPCSDDDLVERVREVLTASPFVGEGYRKVWARLRHAGVRTSKDRVRRLMRDHGLQAPYFPKRTRGSKAHDGTVTTSRPDEMWGTDATATLTVREGTAFVFIAVDHCTSECVGIHASASGSRHEALEPIRQGVRASFGRYERSVAVGLSIRHDHGSQYMSHDFQQELRFLGVTSTPAFVAEPECNGVAERFIRTLKEQLLWVETFDTIEELRLALIAFKHRYNTEWLVQKHGHVTPAQARANLVQSVAVAA